MSACSSVYLCNVCYIDFSGRKNEAINGKFAKNMESSCAQTGIDNGLNRSKEISTVLRKLRTHLFFKGNKKLGFALCLYTIAGERSKISTECDMGKATVPV